jgi:hypothetical protein
MPDNLRLRRIALACTAFLGTLLVAASAHAVPSLRSELYSVGAVGRFCSRAQQIVASTAIYSWNIVHNELDTFANSSSAPYTGPNLGTYNGGLIAYPNGDQMPLITQQLISQRELTQTQWEYPIVISCKMKDAESINYYFGAGSAGTQRSCREVNQDTVASVFASLNSIEQRSIRFPQNEIVYLSDIMAASGPNWLYPLPYLPRVAFIPTIGVNAGKLAFRGYAIAVARTVGSGDVAADKKGVYYCHLPSPEYVRALVTGQMEPIIENPPEF